MCRTSPGRLMVHTVVLLCSAWVAAVTTEDSSSGTIPRKDEESPSTPSPFASWDEASAEQEALSEGSHRSTETPSIFSSSSSPPPTTFLIMLLGNDTVARLRSRDFAKYVRVNLAARLSLEYDEVGIAGVAIAPPAIVVNVTVNRQKQRAAGSGKADAAAALMRMAQTNATLLELSGEEYRVTKVITATSMLTPKPLTEGSTAALRHEEVERGVFTAAGAAVALLLLAAALGAMARLRRCGSPKPTESPPLPPPPPPPPIRPRRRPLAPPKVIYTGAFALTLGGKQGRMGMVGPGGCAIHSRMPITPAGFPGAGRRVVRPEAGSWRSWDERGRRGRHLLGSDCSFDNPNFEK